MTHRIPIEDHLDLHAFAPRDVASVVEEYRQKFANPYIPAGRGFFDDVIDPRHTRRKIIRSLEMLQNKADRNPPKKHGNIPL